MNRKKFIDTFLRAALLAGLAFLLFSLGRKASAANNCSSCPGKGICNGQSDCSLFLKNK